MNLLESLNMKPLATSEALNLKKMISFTSEKLVNYYKHINKNVYLCEFNDFYLLHKGNLNTRRINNVVISAHGLSLPNNTSFSIQNEIIFIYGPDHKVINASINHPSKILDNTAQPYARISNGKIYPFSYDAIKYLSIENFQYSHFTGCNTMFMFKDNKLTNFEDNPNKIEGYVKNINLKNDFCIVMVKKVNLSRLLTKLHKIFEKPIFHFSFCRASNSDYNKYSKLSKIERSEMNVYQRASFNRVNIHSSNNPPILDDYCYSMNVRRINDLKRKYYFSETIDEHFIKDRRIESKQLLTERSIFERINEKNKFLNEIINFIDEKSNSLEIREGSHNRFDILNIGYSKEKKLLALTKLRTLIYQHISASKEKIVLHSSHIDVLRNGETGEILRSIVKKHGYKSLREFLEYIKNNTLPQGGILS